MVTCLRVRGVAVGVVDSAGETRIKNGWVVDVDSDERLIRVYNPWANETAYWPLRWVKLGVN